VLIKRMHEEHLAVISDNSDIHTLQQNIVGVNYKLFCLNKLKIK